MRNLVVLILMLLPGLAFANGYENYPSALSWSPDSTLLASVEAASWPYNDGLVAGSLRLYHFDGTPLHELLAGVSVGSPAFSADGRLACVHDGKIAVFEGYLEPSSVRFISASQPVLDCTFEPPQHPGYLPTILASCGERFYGADIWRINFDGRHFTAMTLLDEWQSAVQPLSLAYDSFLYLQQPGDNTGAAYERLFHWHRGAKETEAIQFSNPTPDGSYPDNYHESNAVVLSYDPLEIIFQRGGWGDWKLIRLGIDGIEHVELEHAEQPSLSADSRWLAFQRRPAYAKAQAEHDWDVIPQIWLADRECRSLWHVPHSIAGGEFPTLSPDGSKLAWIEFNDGRVQTVVRSVEEITAEAATETY
jgi:hypothetical protein